MANKLTGFQLDIDWRPDHDKMGMEPDWWWVRLTATVSHHIENEDNVDSSVYPVQVSDSLPFESELESELWRDSGELAQAEIFQDLPLMVPAAVAEKLPEALAEAAANLSEFFANYPGGVPSAFTSAAYRRHMAALDRKKGRVWPLV